ncbi:MAG TPA: NAD(P)-dependent oxidoreductase [Mycobacteriales bacterium]|nr:NAD(P)-dependent oxidoreductase [Mycobacteriales bacterium]
MAVQDAGTVLVTGAWGLVGSHVVPELLRRGHRVVAVDLETRATRRRARRAGGGDMEARWCDLTDEVAVGRLLDDVQPSAIVHLAGIIPPFTYANPGLARRVNVGATQAIVRAAERLPHPPRIVLASSLAVYGARNPHRFDDLVTAATPTNPVDSYGAHKVAAERIVTSSRLEWVVLRLGGVMTPYPRWNLDPELVRFEAVMPADGRMHTIDVRDVARAFAAASTTEAVNEVFLVAGDASHRIRQHELSSALIAAMGLPGGLPEGRPGDPDSETGWFPSDWMDTERSQQVLGYQHHSLPEMLATSRAKVGPVRHVLRPFTPVVRRVLARRSPYRRTPGQYAEIWSTARLCWGSVEPGELEVHGVEVHGVEVHGVEPPDVHAHALRVA